MVLAGHQPDRPDLDPFTFEVDDDLAQPEVAILTPGLGPDQRDHGVGEVRAGGPDLGPIEAPAALDRACRGCHRGEVGTRVRLAHADREVDLAARDSGQKPFPLPFAAVAEEERARLPVGNPVGGHRGPGRQQLLDHDMAFERTSLATPVAAGPGHAEPAALAEAAAEGGVGATQPRVAARHKAARGEFVAQEAADLSAQCNRLFRQLAGCETERNDRVEGRHQDRLGPAGDDLLGLVVTAGRPVRGEERG